MLRALSLYEPWATAMALGYKTVETRSWKTSYRGDLAICAGRKRMIGCYPWWFAASAEQYGMCVCVVEVYDCIPTEEFYSTGPTIRALAHSSGIEAELGDYSPGRFAWLTKNLRKLKTPVPIVGRQGLWTLHPVLEAKVLKSTLQEIKI